MKTRVISLFALAGWAACAGSPAVHSSSSERIVARAESMRYGPCPPAVPFVCEMSVLEGSPRTGGLFTMRVRTTEPWVMPPHSHPRDERVTVLSGRIGVGFGNAVDKSKGETFTAGDYYVNPPGAVHYVWADEPVEIQITGMGPWEVHPHQE